MSTALTALSASTPVCEPRAIPAASRSAARTYRPTGWRRTNSSRSSSASPPPSVRREDDLSAADHVSVGMAVYRVWRADLSTSRILSEVTKASTSGTRRVACRSAPAAFSARHSAETVSSRHGTTSGGADGE
ncbi:hypothetical protein LZG04_09660 [Saccharothrix sp. S26]|uniref:hypothetical protein n=1 Tax=Saccharothrix sp. S26 TaxID=2907215 RepID=UPI001F37B8BD|nr:hypothetical protein [Saccharothrix sp. S26]MCE6995072.1 hypothetical protein [Saccharothrix sp. S26]